MVALGRAEFPTQCRYAAAKQLGDALRENFTALGLVTTGASYVHNSGIAEWPTIRGTGELRNLEYVKPGTENA